MAPMDIYNKLKAYYVGYNDKQKPVLSSTSAATFSILFVVLYVIPFYLSPKTRPSPTLNRDAPSVIRARIQTVTLTCIASTVTTFYLLYVTGKYSLAASLHHLGVYPIDPLGILKSLGLTSILYLGPLYESIYIEKELSPLSSVASRVKTELSSWQGYRNYIAGPVTEEILFRSTLVTLHLLAHVSATKITFLTPLYFGIAHLHHFYEFRITHPHTPVVQALFRSIFQLGYTSIFGWYASFVYVRTGNLYAVCIIHAFCNYMGIPRFWGKIRIQSESTFSLVTTRGKDDVDPISKGQPVRDLSLRYTVVYYTLLLGGMYGFYKGLFPLTDNSVALAAFGTK